MKKLLTLLSMLTLVITIALCFNASADDGKIVIDNVVYELTNEEVYGFNGGLGIDFGEHYVATDFLYDKQEKTISEKIIITDEIDGIKVKGIKDYAFYTDPVKKVSLPNTIEYIGSSAFRDCSQISELILPSEIKYIGANAFFGLEKIKSVVIPERITQIFPYTFAMCTDLKSVVIKGNVTAIYEGAFNSCKNLESINFPNSLKFIQEGAFGNVGLKKVELPPNVDICEHAFSNCKSLKKIVFKQGGNSKYNEMLEEAFFKCYNIEAIYFKALPFDYAYIIPESVKDIYFAGSPSLWENRATKNIKEYVDKSEIEVHFYYIHTHSFTRSGNPTCTRGGKFTYSCECGDTQTVTLAKDPDNHSYGSWKITKKATYAAAGTKQRTCKNCKKVQKATVKKLVFGELENLTATVNGNDVILNWDALEGATGYRVYIYDKEQGKNVKLASFKDKTTYTVSDLEAGETYTFRIKPFNKTTDGKVTWSKSFPVSATIQ